MSTVYTYILYIQLYSISPPPPAVPAITILISLMCGLFFLILFVLLDGGEGGGCQPPLLEYVLRTCEPFNPLTSIILRIWRLGGWYRIYLQYKCPLDISAFVTVQCRVEYLGVSDTFIIMYLLYLLYLLKKDGRFPSSNGHPF